MSKWKQELQNLIAKDHQRHEEREASMEELKEQLKTFSGREYFESVIVPAFNKIKEVFEAEGLRVWMQWETNRAWLTIGRGQDKEVKYEVKVAGKTMTSRLYLMMNFGPQPEYPIGDVCEITGDKSGKDITNITTDDIADDFMTAYEAYLGKKS